MSYQAVSWAFYDAPHLLTDKGLPDATARSVLAVLAEHADDQGANAHPSPLRIKYATGWDVRTVQRALDRLEAGRLITATGVTRSGTTIWKLSMHVTRPADEWDNLRADAQETKRDESAKRKARRDRQKSMPRSDVRDAESRMSGTENTGVRDAESRMSSTQRHPNHQEEPPEQPPGLSTLGGTLPPNPLGHDDPAGRRTENQDSLNTVTHIAQDQEGDHRPHARENNDDPGVNNPDNVIQLTAAMREPCPHGRSRRRRRDGTPRCPHCATDGTTAPTEPDTTATTPEPAVLGRSCPNHPGLAAGNRPDGQPRCPICRRLPQERPHAAT